MFYRYFSILSILTVVPFCRAELAQEQLFDQAQKHQTVLRQKHVLEPFQPEQQRQQPMEKVSVSEQDTAVCKPIRRILVDNKTDKYLNHYLFSVVADAGYQGVKNSEQNQYLFSTPLPCLHARDIEKLVTETQNRLIDDGWVTARVLVPEQNLNSAVLSLVLLPGRINQIRIEASNPEQTYSHRLHLNNALPVQAGEILNLRDIEQGLDNLRRLPTVSAKIDIAPAVQQGSSDLIVRWAQQKMPLRIAIGMDNSGTKETGKYLGSLYASYDNLLRINDIFSVSYTHNLLPGTKKTDIFGNTDSGKTNNYSLNYSVPYGYWSLALGHSQYYYDQIVAGQTINYHYSGKSRQWQAEISHVLHRNRHSKWTLSAGLWAKRNFSFINDTEVGVQRRQTGGWKIGLQQLSYLPWGSLSSNIAYKQGKHWFGAIPAPEEVFDEGTAKMGIITGDIQWNIPFHIGESAFNWDSRWHGQYNTTKLTPMDKLSIGGRYTVRGFEGSPSLSAEKGGYSQNNLSWYYQAAHRLYFGLDGGYVSGRSAKQLPGKHLLGSALGIQGTYHWHGQWDYDAYIGKALAYPAGVTPDKITIGFSFNYQLP